MNPKAKVKKAFSPAFHNFVDIDLPGGWLLVEASKKAECFSANKNIHTAKLASFNKFVIDVTRCYKLRSSKSPRPRGNEADYLEIKECPEKKTAKRAVRASLLNM